jgi:hypothetical protein
MCIIIKPNKPGSYASLLALTEDADLEENVKLTQ